MAETQSWTNHAPHIGGSRAPSAMGKSPHAEGVQSPEIPRKHDPTAHRIFFQTISRRERNGDAFIVHI
jgi:hypothetical protein